MTGDDRAFLDSVFERVLAALEEGRAVAADDFLEERERLREPVVRLIRVARDLVDGDDSEAPDVPGYSIVGELGRGGMGTVYLARQDRVGGRSVALKVLPHASAIAPAARERFRNEAHAIAKLRHPNIVAVFDVVDAPGIHAFAMEWVDGETLASLVDSVARAGENEFEGRGWGPNYTVYVCRLGIAVARALSVVHGAGLLHRDVKPSNVLLRRDGTPLLSDFGLVRDTDATASRSGAFVGTLAYAAPEQLRGSRGIDARADVYALGATLYHALALRPPFDALRPHDVLRQVEAGSARPLRRVSARVPIDLQTIVAKAMDPDPERRYLSAADLADDLQRLLDLQPIHARPAGFATRAAKLLRRKRPVVVAALAGSALTLALASAFVFFRFIAPVRVARDVAEARLALLDPQLGNGIYSIARFDSRSGTYAVPFVTDAALAAALDRYDAALRLAPFDDALRREREVVAGARAGAAPPEAEDTRSAGLRAYLGGDVSGAIDAWSRHALEAEPDALVLAALGKLLLVTGRPALAYPRLQEAAQAFPEAGFLVVDFAEAALLCGDFQRAESLLARARGLGRLDPMFGLERVEADLLAATGRDDAARERYEEVCRRSRQAVARAHFGAFLAARGEVERGLGLLIQSVAGGLVCEELVPAAERWWSDVPVHDRRRLLRATLDNSPWPGGLLALLRAYAEVRSSIAPDAVHANGPDLSSFLQRARLGDLCERMEVTDMSKWNEWLGEPGFVKDLRVAAWGASDPVATNRAVTTLGRCCRAGLLLVAALAPTSVVTAQTRTYDAALGTLPESQGWTREDTGDSPAPSVSGGALHQGPTSAHPSLGNQYWRRSDLAIDFCGPIVLEASVRIVSSTDIQDTDGGWKPGYAIQVWNGDGYRFSVAITSTAVFLSTSNLHEPESFPRFTRPTTDAFHVYRLEIDGYVASLSVDGQFLVSEPMGTFQDAGAANNVDFGDSGHTSSNESFTSYVTYTVGNVSPRSGNVDTGGGGSPVDVMFVNGSAGDPVERKVTVAASVPVTLHIDPAPSVGPRGAYSFWIYPGDLQGCVGIVFKKPSGQIFTLGEASACMPINNTLAPGTCPCPPKRGITSERMSAATADLLCVRHVPAPRAPVDLTFKFPAGTFTILSVHQDRNSPSSPEKNLAVGNTIVVVAE